MKKRELFAVGAASLALVASPIINNYYVAAEGGVYEIDVTNGQEPQIPTELNELIEGLFAEYDTNHDLEICGYFGDNGFVGYSEAEADRDAVAALEEETGQFFCIYQEGDYYIYDDHNPDGFVKMSDVLLFPEEAGSYRANFYRGLSYGLISGEDQEHFKGSGKDMTFHATGNFENDYSKILVDDEDVEEANHTDEAGSTIITLKSSYLDTLSVGTHKLTIVYQGGNLDVNFKVSENPDTAASDLPWAAFGILGFSLGMFAVLGIADRFEKRR